MDVIVVAAGTSRRMAGIDKLGAPIGGLPVLARTLHAVAAASLVERIVVVAATERVDGVRAAPWLPAAVVSIVAGGPRRQLSVAAGLAELDRLDAAGGRRIADPVVLIHDGARPLVGVDLIERVAVAARIHGAAIPVVPVAETVKRISAERIVETVDRSDLATAQTPQGFRRSVLTAALGCRDPDGAAEWTDEAALLESCSIPVHVVPGEPGNLKVTVPGDLARVEAALRTGPTPRIGLGQDSHPFGPGEPLALGGIAIAGAPRLHGHSDGDVALHAISDALLGAAGKGDLGRLFPADASTPRGIASRDLLAHVVERLAADGLRPVGIDVTIVGARPRLAGHLDAMQAAIASIVGIDVDRVGVKASTGNLSGEEGAGRVLSARAIAVVEEAR